MDRHHRRRALIETFEQRILYSADPLPSGELVSALVGLEHTDGATADGGGVELVFVDTRSPDLQLLLDDLEAQRQAGRDLEVILIEQDEDGIAKVSEALAGHHDVAAVHLVGHGSEGLIELGASRLNMDVLLQRASEIAGWGDALVDSGDLLLYGCDVAAGTDGEALVTTLSQLTGADVAASIDTTGSALLGGDWDLERQTGSVEARPFASASLQAEWGGVLGVVAQSTETLVNQNTSGSQGNHWSGKTVGMDSSGNYVVVWMDGSGADGSGQGIYARRYDVNGTALGNAFRVNSYTFDSQRNPQVAMAANGSFVVVWESMGQDGSNYGIYAQRYNASGVVQGSEFRVNTLTIDDQREPAVAMDANGNFVITYQAWASGNNSWGVLATRYNASGVVQGAEFVVNTTLDFDQQEPSVAMDSAGNFVITWQSYGQEGTSDGIYAQRYNASGVAQGGEFHVNTTTTDNQNLPTVAMDSSGNFVITWESYAQDGSLQGIYGQRYNSSGVAQGGEFRLNTTTANAQQNPVVTMTGGGSFAVTWQSTAQDGSLEGVYMRLYDASGNPVTGETRVNTTTTGDQHSPSIVSNQNGRMVIAWQGNGSGDGDGVFTQRYTYGFPPVLTMSTGSATYVENAAPLSDAGATVTDPNTTVFNGGQLVVQLTSNGTASDELGIRNDGVGAGQIGVSGANITYGGVVIGTFSGVFGNGSTPLTVTLNGNASVAATQALVRAVTYRDTSDAPSTLTRTLSLTLSDETGWTSNPATISLAVVAQNDAPVHSMPGAQSTPISTSLIFSSANGNPLVVSDADSGGGNLQVSLTITNGSLSLSRITGLSFTSGDGSSDTAMTFSGNLANINAALEGLVYTPTTGYNGAASLGITTSDLGNTGSGGALTDSDSITIQVGAVRFQQDVAGYTGTVDTYVSDGATGTSFGNATTVIVDDGSPVIQGLLRFDSMFGSGAGQIPFGATINSASLSFYVTNRDAADTVSLYTMLGSWSEASTWSSLGSGVQMNGTEAASSPLTTFSAGVSGWNTINGLASSVQVWADNGSNQGWLLASANPGADNWTFASSEYATVSLRPYLVISYTAPIAPTITSNGGGTTASVNTAENATAVTTVTATDADSTASELSYSIVGGTDAGKFSINAATGALRFITAPNYELPTDTGSNNVYDVTVQVSDGFLSDTQAIAVAVTPVNDNTPVISSNGGGATAAISLAENTLPVTTVTASDADLPTSTLTYTIIGGADSARFSLNSSTGQLSFLAAPNYEVPSDAGANNVYDVTVQVSDGTYTDTQAIAVTITAVNDNTPAITSNGGGAAASVSIVEHTAAVTTVTATDADLPAQTLTYSIAGGNDAGQFTVDSGTGVLSFITAPNFESPVDFDANNIYDVIVQVSDGTLASTQAIAVTVRNINEAPILNATPAVALAPIAEDAGAPAGAVGTLVSTLVDIAGGGGWDNFSDPDLGASTGLAVIGADATSGTWYYTINGGSSWSTLGTPTTASARLLAADTQTRVYFAPASNFNGSLAKALTFRAWDRTSGSNGGLADTSTNGGASAFSTATDTAALSVTAVNDEQSIVSNTGATFAEGSLGNIITSTMLRTTDVDNSAAQLVYTLGTAPGVGTLYRSGVALGAGGSFTQADVDSNLLTYTHGGGENTADSFSFTVDDGAGSTSSASFAITITGVNDNAPVITSNGGGGSASISMPENNTAVTTVTATDGDIPTTTLSYSIAGGTDAAHFSINPTTGVLQFVSTADFETPLDVNGDNVYHINVQVSDGSLTDTQTLIVTINDVVNELVVTTAADLTDGDTSSITALLANMGGDGKISLREAILAANNSAGADTITFAIGSGPQVIHLNSVLPAITSVIHIEGTSQTGYAGTPLVMLDGAAAGATATGLEFSPGSSGSSVRGLAIGNFSLYGIHVNQVSAITIAGNDLGTDLSGALAAPNGVGLFISESGNNIVGGTSAADRNIISGNTGGGVVVSGATATNNVIQGNYIGLDRTGTADLGNGGDGVSVQASASNNLIGGTTPAERNVISGNTGSGVRIYSTYTDFNTVSGNYIGTNAAGTANIGNAGQGVELDGVSGNIIGSLTSGGGNLISGNAGDGVLVENGGDGNLIFGNTIVANGEEGIQVWGGAINTVIGHSTPAARNIISGNAMQGIGIYGITSGTVVRGNWIGVAADGVTAQGNGKQGIHVSQASSVMIGGSNPGEGNIIANAGALHPGVSLSDGANGVVIIGNSIYGSSSLGIDLDGDWVTANDPGDADVGSNNLQNTPELLSALLTGSDIALSGTLNSLANTRFRIEFFANPGPHASGYGEGRSYIGFVDVLTDASGNASFGPSYAGALPAGSQYWISSTATRLDGSSNFVETSEFSASIPTNPPVITSDGGGSTAAVSVAEGTTEVTTVIAVDPDGAAQTITYSIVGGADAGRFTINASSGLLEFSASPDFEAPADANGDNLYEVIVRASDGLGGTDSQALSVSVTNVNDEPGFSFISGNVDYAENAGAIIVAPTATVTDPDSANFDGGRLVVYFSSGGQAEDRIALRNEGIGAGQIGVSGGAVTFGGVLIGSWSGGQNGTTPFVVTFNASATPAAVQSMARNITYQNVSDAPSAAARSMVAYVEDGDGSSSPITGGTVTPIPVNDAPVITSNSGGATGSQGLEENATFVTTVTVSDPDGPAAVFSIAGGNDGGKFTIDGSTGVLSFVSAPDFEAPTDLDGNNVYEVIVQVSDGSGGVDTQALSVSISPANDNAPQITSNGGGATAAISLAENTAIVTTVTATDADQPTQTLSYAIVGGADGALFSIDGASGVLSYLAPPDFEAPGDADSDNIYEVTVQVADGAGLTSTQGISVSITAANDNAPEISSDGGGAAASISVEENTTAVTTVTATDVDQPVQTLTYSISGGADAARFQIDGTTGMLSFLTAPDFEVPTDAGGDNVYDVIVQAADGQGGTDTQAIAVTVTSSNDNPPIITSGGTASVAENSTAVMTVTATDADQPAQTLTYSISGGADAARFQINADSGVLSFLTAPDFEAPTDAGGDNVYDVIVQVADGQGGTGTQAIAVTVTSTNDSAPVITSPGTASVAENTTAVMTVTATDADQPAQTLTYSISGGADAARFQIDANTGVLSFLTAPDFEAPTDAGGNNVYDVIVQVSDGQGSTDTQAIAVTVTSANDSAPVITSPGTASVAENTTAVMTVTATDSDQPAQTLAYSIVSGADAAHFQIDANTGVLSFLAAPDFESPTDAGGNNVYDVIVQVSDGQGSTDTQAIAVTVTSANDSAPVITSPGNASVAENTTAVMTVTATDSDQPAQTLAYSIVSGADAAHFQIDANTGVLSFLAAPDFESPTDAGGNNVYDVIVQVSDGQGSTDTQAIAVTVTSANDSAPVITSGNTASVAENTTAVMTVTATDADQPAQT
jgi:type III secretion system FlhB-like substrate exporter